MTIGVEPCASEAALPMTGTKLPGIEFLVEFKALLAASSSASFSPVRDLQRERLRIAWLETRGSPASATELA
jgi:hypothetical protein